MTDVTKVYCAHCNPEIRTFSGRQPTPYYCLQVEGLNVFLCERCYNTMLGALVSDIASDVVQGLLSRREKEK